MRLYAKYSNGCCSHGLDQWRMACDREAVSWTIMQVISSRRNITNDCIHCLSDSVPGDENSSDIMTRRDWYTGRD